MEIAKNAGSKNTANNKNATNKYDQFFDFKMAEINDTDAIIDFIKTYWDKEHILAKSKDFFRFHYQNLDDKNRLNIFLMRDKNGEIVGMLGQVISGIFDGITYFSGSITKVKEGLSVPMAGFELQKRLYDYFGKFIEFAGGANKQTIAPLFKHLGHEVGVMGLYYMLNPKLKKYQIIQHDKNYTPPKYPAKQYQLHEVSNVDSLDFTRPYPRLPFKSKQFLKHRYLSHPIYKYHAYAIKDAENIYGILFLRKVEHLNSNMLMIVDFVGELDSFSHIGSALYDLLLKNQAEAIHLLVAGMETQNLKDCGFEKVDLDSKNVVIPTFFEPFYPKNVENTYVKNADVVIFKAAGDQDNPRIFR